MKELTIEQKAKRYDEVIKVAMSKIKNDKDHVLYEDDVIEIFPELFEDENERIRTFLHHTFTAQYLCKDKLGKWHGEPVVNILGWLEKKGEQKSIWHNEDEEPQRGSLILLVMQSGTPIVAKIIEPNHTFNHGERWAYIDDLFEK